MFTRLRTLAALATLAFVPAALADEAASGMKKGTPPLKSAGALAFGPDGILFVADAPASTVYAIATGDTKPTDVKSLSVAKIDDAIGGLLGTTGADVEIKDMKVNPASGNVYLSVARGKGPGAAPAVIRVGGDGKVADVPLKDVMFSSVKLDNSSKNPRNPTITSIAYHKGELYVAGMTTEEWESNLKAIPFPFSESATKGAGVQIYHGAHGRFETQAPIQTFMAYDIAGQTNLLASYTCTPLVKFPVAEIKKGDKVKGTTVAELGNMNRPLDIIAYSKGGKDYALIANASRGVMKVSLDGVDKIEEISTPVRGGNAKKEAEAVTTKLVGGATAGLKYDVLKDLDGTFQLDKLNDTMAVVVRKTDKGLSLETVALP
ncbi:MAG TPA: hypothetical protein VKD90_19365 [Gemmataceae bacterium]|nr:hypothetical protein [Gemmataceae bacterium]